VWKDRNAFGRFKDILWDGFVGSLHDVSQPLGCFSNLIRGIMVLAVVLILSQRDI
jgi:hypothetical protein